MSDPTWDAMVRGRTRVIVHNWCCKCGRCPPAREFKKLSARAFRRMVKAGGVDADILARALRSEFEMSAIDAVQKMR